MQTVDPAGTSDDLRWALARTRALRGRASPRQPSQPTRRLWRWRVRSRQLQVARGALQQRRQERTLNESVSAAAEALSRAREHLRRILDRPPGPASSDKCHTLANRVIKMRRVGRVFGFWSGCCRHRQEPRSAEWVAGRTARPGASVASIKTALQELARVAAENERAAARATTRNSWMAFRTPAEWTAWRHPSKPCTTRCRRFSPRPTFCTLHSTRPSIA